MPDIVERMRALLDGSREVDPYRQDDRVYVYCGKACRVVTARVTVGNHNDPGGTLYVFCETRGCSCRRTAADLPRRYKVSQGTLQYEAARALPALLELLEASKTINRARGFVMWDPKVHLAVSALVYDDRGRLLLMRRGPACGHGAGTWAPPGGWVDAGEHPEDAVRRELDEEVGLPLLRLDPRPLGVSSVTMPPPLDTVVGLYYRAHADLATHAPHVREPDKADMLDWVPPDRLWSLRIRDLLFPPFRQFLTSRNRTLAL